MNNQQAIEELKCYTAKCGTEHPEEIEIAIRALEKQIPQKINFEMNLGDCASRFICECGKRIVIKHDCGVMNNNDAPNYCPNCGKRFDWS